MLIFHIMLTGTLLVQIEYTVHKYKKLDHSTFQILFKREMQ